MYHIVCIITMFTSHRYYVVRITWYQYIYINIACINTDITLFILILLVSTQILR